MNERIQLSATAISSSRARKRWTSVMIRDWQKLVSSPSVCMRISGITFLKAAGDCAIARPRSPRRPLAWLIIAVRCWTRSSRTGCGLDDSFSVVAIILVRFNERRNVVGTDEANLETCFLETSRPVMGRATRFHRDRAGTEGPHCFDQRRSGNLVAVYRPAAYIGAVELKDALGEVNAEKIDFHDVPPHGFPKARRPVSRGRSVGSISVAVVQSLGPGDGGGATRHPAVSGVRAAGHGHNAAARREHDPAVPPPA